MASAAQANRQPRFHTSRHGWPWGLFCRGPLSSLLAALRPLLPPPPLRHGDKPTAEAELCHALVPIYKQSHRSHVQHNPKASSSRQTPSSRRRSRVHACEDPTRGRSTASVSSFACVSSPRSRHILTCAVVAVFAILGHINGPPFSTLCYVLLNLSFVKHFSKTPTTSSPRSKEADQASHHRDRLELRNLKQLFMKHLVNWEEKSFASAWLCLTTTVSQNQSRTPRARSSASARTTSTTTPLPSASTWKKYLRRSPTVPSRKLPNCEAVMGTLAPTWRIGSHAGASEPCGSGVQKKDAALSITAAQKLDFVLAFLELILQKAPKTFIPCHPRTSEPARLCTETPRENRRTSCRSRDRLRCAKVASAVRFLKPWSLLRYQSFPRPNPVEQPSLGVRRHHRHGIAEGTNAESRPHPLRRHPLGASWVHQGHWAEHVETIASIADGLSQDGDQDATSRSIGCHFIGPIIPELLNAAAQPYHLLLQHAQGE